MCYLEPKKSISKNLLILARLTGISRLLFGSPCQENFADVCVCANRDSGTRLRKKKSQKYSGFMECKR